MRKPKEVKPYYACVVQVGERQADTRRSSFYSSLPDAIEYAERMFGIIRIEEVGGNIVWTRPVSE